MSADRRGRTPAETKSIGKRRYDAFSAIRRRSKTGWVAGVGLIREQFNPRWQLIKAGKAILNPFKDGVVDNSIRGFDTVVEHLREIGLCGSDVEFEIFIPDVSMVREFPGRPDIAQIALPTTTQDLTNFVNAFVTQYCPEKPGAKTIEQMRIESSARLRLK